MERNRRYSVNERYFKEINSKDKGYNLGFIYADGYVNKYCLTFTQHKNDREVLEYIKEYLDYSGPIFYDRSHVDKRNGQTYYHDRLQINSKKLVEDLNKQGVVQKKSLVLEAPPINQEFIGSFIRGYFDGDGTAGLYKNRDSKCPHITFYGTFELLSWIKDNTENSLNIYPKDNIYELKYQSQKSIMPLIELMGESPFGLARKTKKLNEIVSYLEKSNVQKRKRIRCEKMWKTRREKQVAQSLELPIKTLKNSKPNQYLQM